MFEIYVGKIKLKKDKTNWAPNILPILKYIIYTPLMLCKNSMIEILSYFVISCSCDFLKWSKNMFIQIGKL